MKTLYDLLDEIVKFQEKKKLETLFPQIENSIQNHVTLTSVKTNIPIVFYCSFFLNWYRLCSTPNV